MTLPREWSFPTKERFLADPLSYLADMYATLAEEIANPTWKLQGTVAVAAGLTTLVVPVEIDRLPAEVMLTPSWGTTAFATAVGTTGFTANFGTAAPGGGGTLYYVIIQQEAGPA